MDHKEQNSDKTVSKLLEFGKEWNLKNRDKIIGYYIQKQSSIQKYESGKTEIPRSVLEKIASVLGVHILELLDTTSSIEWCNKRDDAIIALLASLGCEITIGTDEGRAKSTIHYKGDLYRINTNLLLDDLFSDIEDDTLHLVGKFLKKHSTKIYD